MYNKRMTGVTGFLGAASCDFTYLQLAVKVAGGISWSTAVDQNLTF